MYEIRSGVERPLKASVPTIPLRREFPCVVWYREGILSMVWSSFQSRASWKVDTDWFALLSYIMISIPKRKVVLIRLELSNLAYYQELAKFTAMSQPTYLL